MAAYQGIKAGVERFLRKHPDIIQPMIDRYDPNILGFRQSHILNPILERIYREMDFENWLHSKDLTVRLVTEAMYNAMFAVYRERIGGAFADSDKE